MNFFFLKPKPITLNISVEDGFANLRFLLKSQMDNFDDNLAYAFNDFYTDYCKSNSQLRIPTQKTGCIPDQDQQWYLLQASRFMIRHYGIPLPINRYKHLINLSNLFQLPQYTIDQHITSIGKDLVKSRSAMELKLSIT